MRRLTQPGGFGVEERDNEMSVSSALNRDGAINLEVEVPMRTKLRVSIVDGGITVDGVDGEMEINTVDGGIMLMNVGGSVVAHAVDGNINAIVARVAPQAPMAFTSLNGDIDVTLPAAVKANLRLRSDQGRRIYGFRCAGDCRCQRESNAAAQWAGSHRCQPVDLRHGERRRTRLRTANV
jgi:DUF4097 and DUF4098 domain-containing protein YvlB